MIVLTGATGQNGGEVAKQLAAAGVPYRAVVRDGDKARGKLPEGAEAVVGDLADPASLDRALAGATAVFVLSSVAPNQAKLQGNVAEAAARAGTVRRIVKFSALGADATSPRALERWHGEAERHIEATGIAWSHMRPNSLFQNALRSAKQVVREGVLAAPMGDAAVSMVDVRDVAAVICLALTQLDDPRFDCIAYNLTGPAAVTWAEWAQALSNALDRPVRYQDVPPEKTREGMAEQAMPSWAVDAIGELLAEQRAGHAASVSDAVPRLLERPAIPLAQAMQDLAPSLRQAAS